MSEEHDTLDMDYDKNLISDVLDSSELRYISLYMFSIRKDLFRDLLDDDIIDEYNSVMSRKDLTKIDLQKICSKEFIEQLIKFRVISNVSNVNSFSAKKSNDIIRFRKGLLLHHEELHSSEFGEEIHILVKEEFLLNLVSKEIPELSLSVIHKGLERMRAMMCPTTSTVHKLIHNYGDYYVLDDDFFSIIEELGNPFQALRIELMIRKMSDIYKETGKSLSKLLALFDRDLPTAKLINKLFKKKKEEEEEEDLEKESERKSADESKQDLDEDYLSLLVKKTRKKTLPTKFHLESLIQDANEALGNESDLQLPETFTKWKDTLNLLLKERVKFEQINKEMDTLRSYYSGADQIMSYMDFIEKTTYNEDNISEKIAKSLLSARNKLKSISQTIDDHTKKDLKVLNLNIERYIIENDLEPEDDEEDDD